MTSVETTFRDKSFIIETGKIARQADGSTVLKYGDTFVLATAVASKTERVGIDFFTHRIDISPLYTGWLMVLILTRHGA